MSTGGQAVGGLVGGIAGFFLAGPLGASALTSSLYGAQLGMMAGGYLDPPKGPTVNGPRLDDLSVQTSTYGAVIPRVYGAVTVNGNVFWLENNTLKETVTKKKSGGKGGGSKTTTRSYSYSATFAVGLCKGPIAGVRRIWIGADLIYDADSSDPATIQASNDAAAGFHVYLGTNTQAPDARMQATLGVANTPAWCGLAYIVFYDLALARYGNSLMGAQIKAEIVTKPLTNPIYAYTTVNQYTVGAVTFNAVAAFGAGLFVCLRQSTTTYTTSPDGAAWTVRSTIPAAQWSTFIYENSLFIAAAYSQGIVTYSSDGLSWSSISWPGSYQGQYLISGLAYGNGVYAVCSTNNGSTWYTTDLTTWHAGSGLATADSIAFNGSIFIALRSNTTVTDVYRSTDGINWSLVVSGIAHNSYSNICTKGSEFLASSTTHNYLLHSPDGTTWTEYSVGSATTSISTDGLVWVLASTSNYYVTNTPSSLGSPTSLTYSGSNWRGFCWNGTDKFVVIREGTVNRAVITRTVVTPGSTGITYLSEIVSAESLQSGLLTSGDIDVTSLTQEVRGYRVGSIGAIRAALEPLQAAWPFDVVQHGYQIRYVMRGGSSVVTIPAADLDARGAGQEPGVQITTSREMDSQLPRRVTVQHLDYDREYNAGSQYAERLNTAAINAMVLDLPIVLTATEAAGKAEVLLYLYWLERYDVAITLPATYLQLEPGDVVTLITPEGNVSLRLTAVNYTSDGRVECKAKYANAAIYTPTAVAASPAVTGPTTITPVGASVYALLDVPLVSSAQSGPSFLAAMTGALAGWQGGVLMQSTDAGATWASLHDFGAPGADMGTCSNSLGAVESRMIDAASALSVTMTQGALFSVTQLAMLAGGNHFAYGSDGRWEIIAAQECTLVSGTSYTLTNLLRGRFGTEWAMSLHAAGDALVLLDTTDVAAITMSAGSIGLGYLYRGITVDRDISTDGSRTFAYQGVNLKPLSPIALTGAIDPATADWSLSWIRRTRTGGEWRDYVDADLGESSEAYQIDVSADGTYATVKRTITATSPAASYTSAQQVTDFGSNQATLYLKVYQVSSVIGRGYPLTQSITR